MKIAHILILLLPLLLFTACIDFEGQTLTYRYDNKNDRLLIFLIYENIHAGGEYVDQKEKEQLELVMKDQLTFFFSNVQSVYNRKQWLEEVQKNKKNLDKIQPDKKKETEILTALLADVIEFTEVTNGGCYLNGNNQLCGYQYITVSNVTELLSLFNKYLSAAFLSLDLAEFRESNRKRSMAFIKAGEWISLEGNQFRYRCPFPYDSFMEERKDFLFEKKEKIETNMRRNMLVNNILVNYDEPILEFVVGHRDVPTGQVSLPAGFNVHTNLIDYVRETYGINENADIDKIRSEFLTTGKIPQENEASVTGSTQEPPGNGSK